VLPSAASALEQHVGGVLRGDGSEVATRKLDDSGPRAEALEGREDPLHGVAEGALVERGRVADAESTTLSNGSFGLPGTRSTSPALPVAKPLLSRRQMRPESRQSTRPAIPWGGRSFEVSVATRTSVPDRSSFRRLGGVEP